MYGPPLVMPRWHDAAAHKRIITMQIASVGFDLGKTTFHFVALDDHGKIVAKSKFTGSNF